MFFSVLFNLSDVETIVFVPISISETAVPVAFTLADANLGRQAAAPTTLVAAIVTTADRLDDKT